MAFAKLLKNSLEVAGHGIAAGATQLADEVTGKRVPELQHAVRDQKRRCQAAARDVEENARIVGRDLNRVLGTTDVSLKVLANIISSPSQLKRLLELIETHDFMALIGALKPGVHLPNGFFPNWIRRAGGYFPKFAQVLSVRADLIHNREVLEQLSRCLEDMPVHPMETVRDHLVSQGWDSDICDGVGDALNSGSVAQVNALVLPDGTCVVVKVAWPHIRTQMEIDFRLFSHARSILAALRLEDEQTDAVAAIFSAVGKNEAAVLREFDMLAEAQAMQMAQELCANHWDVAYAAWLTTAEATLTNMPPPLGLLSMTLVAQLRTSGWHVCVPEPLIEHCTESAMAMSMAGGFSMHQLLTGAQGEAGQREAAQVLIGFAVPFIGWLLLCKSTSHIAHVDPHPGNFRWDSNSRTLWVLDWGSNITIEAERRRALCLLISVIAHDGNDSAIAEIARAFGVQSNDNHRLAILMRGMLNATTSHAAQDALENAAINNILDDVNDDVVPVVRCLATLGGLLKEVQRKIRSEYQQEAPLSLATLWSPFADQGLQAS